MGDAFGDGEPLFVVIDAGKYLVGTTIFKTNEGDPFLAVILETDDIRLELYGSFEGLEEAVRRPHAVLKVKVDILEFLLLLLIFLAFFDADKDARARAVAVNGAPLASLFPSRDIKLIDELFGDVRG